MEWVKNLFSRNYASEETFVQEPQVRELDEAELEGVEGGLGGGLGDSLFGQLPLVGPLLSSLLGGVGGLGGGQQ